jgi:hypothetical protein
MNLNPFAYFKRIREEKRLKIEAELQLKKQRYQENKAEFKAFYDKKGDEILQKDREIRATYEKSNQKCPKCGSTKVVDKISRIQGEINGSSSGSGSSFLGCGSWSSSGSIRGEMDTNEINKCKDCEHEWKKVKYSGSSWVSDKIDANFGWITKFLEDYYKIENSTFDKNDIKEAYSSKEEKIKSLKEKLIASYTFGLGKKFFDGMSLECFNQMVQEDCYTGYSLTKYYMERYNKHYNEDLLINVVGLKKKY